MTATLHALGSGREAGSYYTQDPNREARPDRRDEYYARDARDGGGVWWSTGESVVRSGTPIDRNSFRDLCAGLDPGSGDRHQNADGLVRGAGERHRAGWDLTLSSPKSVGLLWASGDERQRSAIQAAHRTAVEATLQLVEREGLLHVRLGVGGRIKERATDVIVGRFDHFTSREGDPNIHSHCVVFNVAGCEDGTHRTLEPAALYRWTKVVGGYYRACLAERLREIGLEARSAGRGQFEVRGVPVDLIARFSKRSQQIEALVEDRAVASGRQKEIANLNSRQDKGAVPTGEALEARWDEEFAAAGVAVWERAREAARHRDHEAAPEHDGRLAPDAFPTAPEIAGEGAVARAASELFANLSVVDRRQVLEGAYALAPVTRQTTGEVNAELAALEADGRLLRLTDPEAPSVGPVEAVWTTPAIAAAEAAMLRSVDRADERDWIARDAVERALGDAPHLSKEQTAAVRDVAGRDGVTLLEAGAGTGKTTTLRTLVAAARASELDVVGLAPSWVAADELAKSTEVPSAALARWSYDRDRGHAAPWTGKTVVLVDEAGMVGTRDLSRVLVEAKDSGAKVVLVGDRRQLESVPGGGALRAVADRLERASTIQSVRRQEVDWQRSASRMMARGDVGAGLQAYSQRGAIALVDGIEDTLKRTVAAWSELRSRHGDEVVMTTRRNADAAQLNRIAREALRKEEKLLEDETVVRSVDRKGRMVDLHLAVGDRIRFGETLPRHGLRNGTRAEVLAIEDKADPTVSLRLEDGRKLAARWSSFGRIVRGQAVPPRVVHGYAGTVHSVQGRTVPAAVMCVTTRTDAREVYVGMTRHTCEAVMVAEKDRLTAAATRPDALVPSAIQVMETLVGEAGVMREKGNVVDYAQDPEAFVATGDIVPMLSVRRHPIVEFVRVAARVGQAFIKDDVRRGLDLRKPAWLARTTKVALNPVEAVRKRLGEHSVGSNRDAGPDLSM